MPRWPLSPRCAGVSSSGAGARITLALEDVALATAGNLGLLTEPQVNGTQRERLGNAIYGQYGQDFTSSDGVRFMVVTLTPRHFRDMVEVTGTGSAVAALWPRRWAWTSVSKATGIATVTCCPACSPPGSPITRPSRSPPRCRDTTVLFERYRTFAEVAEDPKVTDNPLFSRLHQPGVGEYLAPGLPAAFDGVHPASAGRARAGRRTPLTSSPKTWD